MHSYSPSPRQLAVPVSVSRKTSRLVPMRLISRLFETGRMIGLTLRRNRLTASPGSPYRGHGLRPDGEIVVVVSEQPVASLACYR